MIIRTGAVALVSLALMALAAGCDEQRVARLEEGVSTETQVRRQFGEPASVVTRADGSRIFEYPRQPEGWTNYFITIGPDGTMTALRQVLTDANFAKVQAGMAAQEVRALLGRPAKTQRFALNPDEVWEWRFQAGSAGRLFRVTFGPDGRVSATSIDDDPRDAGTVR